MRVIKFDVRATETYNCGQVMNCWDVLSSASGHCDIAQPIKESFTKAGNLRDGRMLY